MTKHILTSLIVCTAYGAAAQPAGSLDPAFGTAGRVVTSVTSGQDRAQGVTIQPDGKILVGGYSTSPVTGKDFLVIRYNADGTPDNTFGTNGVVTTDLQTGSEDVANSIALQADGKIVLGGYCDNGTNKDAALVRYLPDGTIDNTFGTNGITLTNFENSQQDEIRVIRIHALTGKIVAGGSTVISSSVSKPVVARYDADGIIDSTFNSTGIRLLWITSLDYQYLFSVEDLAVQSNGKISAVGWRDFPGLSWDSDYWACRINSDGTMDNTFSTDGVNVYNGAFNGHDRAYAMLLDGSNNIVAAGGGYVTNLRYDLTLFNLTAAGGIGSLSATADYGTLLDDIAYGLSYDNSNHIVLGGSSGDATGKAFALFRVSASGAADNAFGTNGKVTTSFPGQTISECFDIAVQTDDKIVAVGYTGNDIALARYLGTNVPQLNDFQLVTPADLAVNQNYASLAFDWTDAYGATTYTMELDTDPAFPAAQSYPTAVSNKTVTGLLPATIYYWRVIASDGSSSGNYSAVRSFTTNSLENFNLVSPVNNALNQQYASLVLDWSNAVGASSYEVQIDTDPGFASPQTYSTSTSNYTVTNLTPAETYYWRVRANGSFIWGQWTSDWHFTTQAGSSASVDEQAQPLILVYPNPVTDVLYIVTETAMTGQVYTLSDLNGKVLRSGTIAGEETVLNIGTLAAGAYLLQVGHYPATTVQVSAH